MKKMAVLGVALATSGSRGYRLLFFYPNDDASEAWQILRELPPRLMGDLITPEMRLVNTKFELQVDKWKFVGHPRKIPSFKDGEDTRALVFNIVFILEVSSESDLCMQCHELSARLGTCLDHEERRCDYVSHELQGLLNRVEYSNLTCLEDFAQVYRTVAKESSLVKTLISVFNSVHEGATHISQVVNDWSCLTWFHPAEAPPTGQSPSPFHAVLLLKEADQITLSLPPETSSTFAKLISLVSPVKAVQRLSQDADLPLDHVQRLVSHLVQWRRARMIHPLTEANVYMLSPAVDLSPSSEQRKMFGTIFSSVTLFELVQNFSEPLPLVELQGLYPPHEFVAMVAWLLQHELITELNTYVFMVQARDSQATVIEAHSVEEDSSVKQLRAELSPAELHSVLSCPGAEDARELARFATLVQYFRGGWSIADMAQKEQLPRTNILTTVDMFSAALTTATIPDPH